MLMETVNLHISTAATVAEFGTKLKYAIDGNAYLIKCRAMNPIGIDPGGRDNRRVHAFHPTRPCPLSAHWPARCASSVDLGRESGRRFFPLYYSTPPVKAGCDLAARARRRPQRIVVRVLRRLRRPSGRVQSSFLRLRCSDDISARAPTPAISSA